jgi:hypothetical protein
VSDLYFDYNRIVRRGRLHAYSNANCQSNANSDRNANGYGHAARHSDSDADR